MGRGGDGEKKMRGQLKDVGGCGGRKTEGKVRRRSSEATGEETGDVHS